MARALYEAEASSLPRFPSEENFGLDRVICLVIIGISQGRKVKPKILKSCYMTEDKDYLFPISEDEEEETKEEEEKEEEEEEEKGGDWGETAE